MKTNQLYNLLVFSLAFTLLASSALADLPNEFAIGLSGVGAYRGNNMENSFFQMSPEWVGYGYVPLNSSFQLRPGIRANFAWQQPVMPSALQVKEYDFKFGPELGLVLNGAVLPSFTLGMGVLYRNTVLQTQEPVRVTQDSISGSSIKPFIQAQVGLGIPISDAWVVIEPFGRYTKVLGDSRLNWATGIEATLSVF